MTLNVVDFPGLDDDGEEGEDREKSWAEEMEEEESTKDKGDESQKAQAKKSRGLNVQDVIVASCSDDGTVRLWRPLQVRFLSFLMLMVLLITTWKVFCCCSYSVCVCVCMREKIQEFLSVWM